MIYYNLPFSEYRAIEAFNNSSAGLIERSPLHYKSGFREESSGFEFGSLLHLLVLEPEKFGDEYLVTNVSLATKEGKALKADAEVSGQTLIKQAVYDAAHRARDCVLSHEIAGYLLSEGHPEVTMLHDMDGTPVKARMDWLRPDDVIVDLKTTINAQPEAFFKSICNYAYYRQAAFYRDVYELHDKQCEDFYFIAVENTAPYAVSVHKITEDFISAGRKKYRKALATYAACKAVGVWPGYQNEVVIHEAPKWLVA